MMMINQLAVVLMVVYGWLAGWPISLLPHQVEDQEDMGEMSPRSLKKAQLSAHAGR